MEPSLRPPRLALGHHAVAAVPCDLMPAESPVRRLHEWALFLIRVEATLCRGLNCGCGDPFGAFNLAVTHAGDVPS